MSSREARIAILAFAGTAGAIAIGRAAAEHGRAVRSTGGWRTPEQGDPTVAEDMATFAATQIVLYLLVKEAPTMIRQVQELFA